jgi:ribosome-binding protein aMBF1 (putative translation factor)
MSQITWGSKIKQLREMANLSQYELSQRVPEIYRDKLSRFENGYTEPSWAERKTLERVLDEAIRERLALLVELRSEDKRSASLPGA